MTQLTRLQQRRRGLSLVEVTASTVLVAILLVAALRSTANVYMSWSTAATAGKAQLLAQHFLNEIGSKEYVDPEWPIDPMGTEPGESSSNRLTFDDIDDYDNYSQAPPKDASNVVIPGYSGWSVGIEVKKIDPFDAEHHIGDNSSNSSVEKATLTITPPSGSAFTYVVLRSSSGLLEQPLGYDLTIVTSVEHQLTSAGRTETSATAISNHPTSLP